MTRSGHTLYILALLVSAMIGLSACESGVVFDSYSATGTEGWDRGDTIVFNVPGVESDGLYRLEIGMRATSDILFTSVTVVTEREVVPSGATRLDTLRCQLADDKGNILGRGVSRYQYDFILSDVRLRRGDSLRVAVRHVMTRETLPGISDVGLRVTRR